MATLRPKPLTQGVYSTQWNATRTGRTVAEITAKRAGLESGETSVTFRRENGVAENFHQEQNRELLERLAAETGGRYDKPGNARHAGAGDLRS